MNKKSIQMPEVKELKKELEVVKGEIQDIVKEEPELASQADFILEVCGIVEQRLAKETNLDKLERKDQISLIAHLNLFYSLLDDMFNPDFDEYDDEELDIEYTEDEK